MAQSSQDIQNALLDTIEFMVGEHVLHAPFTRIVDGVIMEVRDNYTDGLIRYTVEINGHDYENIIAVGTQRPYVENDLVYVIVVNNNFSDKIILGLKGTNSQPNLNSEFNEDDYPSTPVIIERENNNPAGKAVRFIYGKGEYPVAKQWSQELIRDTNNKVIMVKHVYNKPSLVLGFYLHRNEVGLLEYYGQNPNGI